MTEYIDVIPHLSKEEEQEFYDIHKRIYPKPKRLCYGDRLEAGFAMINESEQ